MLLTFFIIMTITFCLIKMLQTEIPLGKDGQVEQARREALGWNKPILTQYGIYLRNIITKWDWGTSFKVQYMANNMVIAKTATMITLFSIMIASSIINYFYFCKVNIFMVNLKIFC